jgi:hypothetical protein
MSDVWLSRLQYVFLSSFETFSENISKMLDNLRNPPEPFEDVIRTHFRLKARSIMTQLDGWLAKDDKAVTVGDGGGFSQRVYPGAGGNDFAQDVNDMKALLRELEAEK